MTEDDRYLLEQLYDEILHSGIGEKKCCAMNDLIEFSTYDPCTHCPFQEGMLFPTGPLGETMCNCYVDVKVK